MRFHIKLHSLELRRWTCNQGANRLIPGTLIPSLNIFLGRLAEWSLEIWWERKEERDFPSFSPLFSFLFSLRLYVMYWEALTVRGTFFRLQLYERIGISLVGVYERVGRSVILVCKKGYQMLFMAVKSLENVLGFWFIDLCKTRAFTPVKRDAKLWIRVFERGTIFQ